MKNNNYKIGFSIAAIAAVAVSTVVLTLAWRSNQTNPADQAEQQASAAQEQSTVEAVPSSTAQQSLTVIDEAVETDVAEAEDEALEDTELEKLQPSELLNNTLTALREQISTSGATLEHSFLGVTDDNFALRLQMLEAINQDPLLIDSLLELFEQDPDSLLGRELSAVLSATGSPKAQTLALDIAANASLYANEERAAALLMLGEMDGITSETRDGLLGNIQQETDSDLTQFSLMALKNAPSTAEDYANVHSVLQETLYRDDANVRRHASYQIGEWATSSEDLEPLRTMAVEETDHDARARAVMSLGDTGYKDDDSKSVLYSVTENDESPLIRQQAWIQLESFPLTDTERADYIALGERIQLDVDEYEKAQE